MASMIFDSFFEDVFRGSIDVDTDTFKMMLVTATYAPDKGTHTKRSQVTNEVVGAGYTAGGQAVTPTISKDTSNHRIDISFSDPSWPAASIAARAGVIYKSRGGASSADELVGYVDFGGTITSTGGAFDVDVNSPLRIQN